MFFIVRNFGQLEFKVFVNILDYRFFYVKLYIIIIYTVKNIVFATISFQQEIQKN